MKIYKAKASELDIVCRIVRATIEDIYPNYYPLEVVNFFLQHHREENILSDLKKGLVYLLSDKSQIVGTGTLEKNHIKRVFVLPEFQGKGYGAAIMNYLEDTITDTYASVYLDASLPSYSFYLRRGYHPLDYNQIKVNNGRILCYYSMEKRIVRKSKGSIEMKIDHVALYTNDLEGMKAFYMKYFGAVSNDGYHNPKTGLRTYFLSFQDGSRLEIMTRPNLELHTAAPYQTGYTHLAFSVGSPELVDSLTATLEQDGCRVVSRPRTTGDGYYESCILDPDGNQIEIVA